jgi:hypothetical protein
LPRFDHDPIALPGTERRVKDRLPRNGSDPSDYPLTAECGTCHLEVWMESYESPRFEHVTRAVAAQLGMYKTG